MPVIHLAVMAGKRKPKVVTPGKLDFYREKARKLWKFDGTADEARKAIEEGLPPIFENGNPTGSSAYQLFSVRLKQAMEEARRLKLGERAIYIEEQEGRGLGGSRRNAAETGRYSLFRSSVSPEEGWRICRLGNEYLPTYNNKRGYLPDDFVRGRIMIRKEDYANGVRWNPAAVPMSVVWEAAYDNHRQ